MSKGRLCTSKNRRDTDYLGNIQESVRNIEDYVNNLTYEDFINDRKPIVAYLRRLPHVVGSFPFGATLAGSGTNPVLYTSTVEFPAQNAFIPPMAYIFPFTALVDKALLAVSMSAFLVHVSVAGSYSSTIGVRFKSPRIINPPIAYIFPSTAQADNQNLEVGTSAFFSHVSVAGSYSYTAGLDAISLGAPAMI